MFVAKVTGSLVATQKVDTMVGYKLLVVEPYRLESQDRKSLATTGRTFIAVDTLHNFACAALELYKAFGIQQDVTILRRLELKTKLLLQ